MSEGPLIFSIPPPFLIIADIVYIGGKDDLSFQVLTSLCGYMAFVTSLALHFHGARLT